MTPKEIWKLLKKLEKEQIENDRLRKKLKEKAKEIQNNLKLAYQCMRYKGVEDCDNKDCLNMLCPLNLKQKHKRNE